jgi:hypothetical protein
VYQYVAVLISHIETKMDRLRKDEGLRKGYRQYGTIVGTRGAERVLMIGWTGGIGR